jgi:hypothetical protein
MVAIDEWTKGKCAVEVMVKTKTLDKDNNRLTNKNPNEWVMKQEVSLPFALSMTRCHLYPMRQWLESFENEYGPSRATLGLWPLRRLG